MHKWQSTITLTVVCIAIAGYLVFTPAPTRKTIPVEPSRWTQGPKNDGDDEAGEVIEPLVVLNWGVVDKRGESGAELLPRVELVPGVQQPPRPDAEPNKALRMPY